MRGGKKGIEQRGPDDRTWGDWVLMANRLGRDISISERRMEILKVENRFGWVEHRGYEANLLKISN